MWRCGVLLWLAGCAALAPETAPLPLPAPAVQVTYADPSRLSDAKALGQQESNVVRREWIGMLIQHLTQQATPRLSAGERLYVQFVDIRRAGRRESDAVASGLAARIVSEAEPPMLVLEWRRIAADGEITHMGRRVLDSRGFIQRAQHYAGDFLRYERAVLDMWVEQELATN